MGDETIGFCVAELKRDDNGNEYYQRRSDAFATAALTEEWRVYAGLDYGEVVSDLRAID